MNKGFTRRHLVTVGFAVAHKGGCRLTGGSREKRLAHPGRVWLNWRSHFPGRMALQDDDVGVVDTRALAAVAPAGLAIRVSSE